MARELSELEFHRYARHLILDEVGEEGQEKLLESSVLVVGAGGLGAPAMMYLAAAGVGTIGIVDDDEVDLTNLQRQIIHATGRVGARKVESATACLAEINPGVAVTSHDTRFDADNAASLIAGYDLVLDGSDNFATRYAVNDACVAAKKPLVAAAILRFEGQLFAVDPRAKPPGKKRTACYRCIFPEPPREDLVPRCEQAGVLGALAGVMGSLQASEALKLLLGIGESLAGHMLLYDALDTRFRKIKVTPDRHCATCGS